MRMILAATLAIAPLAIAPLWAKDNDSVKRLNETAVVFSEIMATPDKGIPEDLLARAHCIVIVPSEKSAAFLVGAKYGKGYVSCRRDGGWSAPGTVIIEGGSFGFQIGGSSDGCNHAGDEPGAERTNCFPASSLWARTHRLPPGR
jgi:lipid-binding SYLF domain-containing protein